MAFIGENISILLDEIASINITEIDHTEYTFVALKGGHVIKLKNWDESDDGVVRRRNEDVYKLIEAFNHLVKYISSGN